MLMEITDIIKQEIRMRAFDIYEFRCDYGIPGDALSDWLEAQKEILNWYNPNRQEHAKQFQKILKEGL